MSSKSPSQSGSSSGAINSSSSESSNNGFVIAYGSDRKGDETRIPAAKPSIKLETAKVENSCLSSVVRDPKLSATFSQKINSNQTFDGVFANGNSVGGEGYELSTLGYKAPLQCRNQNLNGGRIDKPLVYKKEAPQEINEPRPSQYDFVATPSSKAEVTGVPESGSTNIAQQPLSESATKQVVDPDTPDRIVIRGYCWSVPFLVLALVGTVFTFPILALAFFWHNEWFVSFACRRSRLRDATVVVVRDRFSRAVVSKVHMNPLNEEVRSLPELQQSLFNCVTEWAHSPHAKVRYFVYLKARFNWCESSRSFRRALPVPESAATSNVQLSCASLYESPTGLSAGAVALQRTCFGDNTMNIHLTPIYRLILNSVISPFYLFQIFTIALWSYESFYIFAILVGIISIISILVVVVASRLMERKIKMTLDKPQNIKVLRNGEVIELLSNELVSLDTLVIPTDALRYKLSADCVLLSGTVIVDESMLTGETLPITKTPPNPSRADVFSVKEQSRHVLYSGTIVLQARAFQGELVHALVVRTGFSSAKGELLRSVLYPKPLDFVFERHGWYFAGFLLFLGILGIGYAIWDVVCNSFRLGYPIVSGILSGLDLITLIVPPTLPMFTLVAVFVGQIRLRLHKIFCVNSSNIIVCGAVNCCCFDKTGTLTESGLDVYGLLPFNGINFGELITNPSSDLPFGHTLYTISSCHSLVRLEGELVGDPADVKTFEASGWTFEENCSYSLDGVSIGTAVWPSTTSESPFVKQIEIDGTTANDIGARSVNVDIAPEVYVGQPADTGPLLGIVKQFTFTSQLQRMSVLAVHLRDAPCLEDVAVGAAVLYVKGAPEKIASLSTPSSVPSDFKPVLDSYSARGYRVIALAYRSLAHVSLSSAINMQRDELERDLIFIGLLVFENRLKKQTKHTIAELNGAKLRLLMITGDNILTALCVARESGLLPAGARVITVDGEEPADGSPAFLEFREEKNGTAPNGRALNGEGHSEITAVYENAAFTAERTGEEEAVRGNAAGNAKHSTRFAITGKAWAIANKHMPHYIDKLLLEGAVFARFLPEQKQSVLEGLNKLGYYTSMCGDGGNDCGALKAAHAGIALSQSEATCAAPFTSRVEDIRCVPEVIRQGRCALMSSYDLFKMTVLYSVAITAGTCIMLWWGTEFFAWEYNYPGYFVYSPLSVLCALHYLLLTSSTSPICRILSLTHPQKALAPATPPKTILSWRPIISMFVISLISIAYLVGAILLTVNQSWFIPGAILFTTIDSSFYEATALSMMALMEYAAATFIVHSSAPFRRALPTNLWLFVYWAVQFVFAYGILVLWETPFLRGVFMFLPFPSRMYNVVLVLFGLTYFWIAYFIEMAVNAPWEQWLRIRRRPKYPHEKLRALLDDLQMASESGSACLQTATKLAVKLDESEVSWPPLGQRFAK